MRYPNCVNIYKIEFIRKKDKDYNKYEYINGYKGEIFLKNKNVFNWQFKM